MRNTTTTVVIAAGVVLAAVIVTRTPAQQEVGGSGACCLGTGGCVPGQSEAGCAQQGGIWLGAFTECAGSTCPSPPTVVGVSTDQVFDNGTSFDIRVTRVWSDGQIDSTVYTGPSAHGSCGNLNVCPVIVLVPGTCPTDINRDGDTGIQDFLTLLGGWGACQ